MRRHHETGVRKGGRSPNIALQRETGQEPRYRKHLKRRTPIRSASRFVLQHPDETPEHHSPLQTISSRSTQSRFINRYDSREISIPVDRSCINNESKDEMARPSGGLELPFKGDMYHDGGIIGFPLEESGPGGESYNATSNRAKLRAVIAALEFRAWHEEGWRRIVIATDLKYVVDGATTHLPQWVRRGWRTSRFKNVINRDLWEELNGIIQSLQRSGTLVSFWLLHSGNLAKTWSALVRETKAAVKKAAIEHIDKVALEFTRLCAIML
ncbi:ribonuclease H-like protein [Daldinia bambusicola]|nr:ribonuclease H-like protein [Daldinia bambusicola]